MLNNISENNAAVKAVSKSIESLNQTVNRECEALSELKEKAELDAHIIEKNQKIVEAYNSIVHSLKEYAENLPLELAHDLAKKTVDYYNAMNCDDADFELLYDLKLPLSQNDKIIVRMKDGTEQKTEWQLESRSKSWTPEMKAKAAADARRRGHGKKCN